MSNPTTNNPTANNPTTMHGVYLTGHGGFDKLEYRDDIPVPSPAAGEVLVQVGAAGINNTDINTRIGWYSKQVRGDTNSGGSSGFDSYGDDDATWSGTALELPRIQGADACGVIVGLGAGVNNKRLGERVLLRSVQSTATADNPFSCVTMGSEYNGGFAQFLVAPSQHCLAVNSTWSNIELAAIPCAYSTAEGMLQRANVGAETVLILGASGGVGCAAVQLCKRRGAQVIAVASESKAVAVQALGADRVIDRDADFVAQLGENSIDVVVDVVAGEQWPSLLNVLKFGGRYVTSGAIAGPIVELDVRTLYLKDLSFFGSTFQPNRVFEDLIGYIERDEIRPVVAKSYPLSEIVTAQQDFLRKQHIGKLVLIPPAV